MQILKFGGTSVANAGNIGRVVQIINEKIQKGSAIVVVSAFSGITDLLLEAAALAAEGNVLFRERINKIERSHIEVVEKLIPMTARERLITLITNACLEIRQLCNSISLLEELTPRSKDRICSYGEWLSSNVIAEACNEAGIKTIFKDARELIVTNTAYTAAEVDFFVTNEKIKRYFSNQPASVILVPGFIAADRNGITTTLGRGGSDYTAAIIAAAIEADSLEIWTDVSGMMTADPRLTSNAKVIPHISYLEAMELSHFGAKVIYPPTIQPVMNKGIPVWIKNTFSPGDHGTLIAHKNYFLEAGMYAEDNNIVRGISSINDIILISLEGSGMIGIPGFSKRLFEALSNEKINVILITQSSSEHSITVAINANLAARAKHAVDEAFANEIALQKVEPLKLEADLSIVALVGENMKNHTGVSGRMFGTMGRNGVNVRAIAQGSSERNISAVIATKDVRKTINILHEAFFETTFKQVNVFLTGTGNVARKLIAQMGQQLNFLQEQMRMQVRLTGICNSRHMLISEDGINLQSWQEQLEAAPPADLQQFVNNCISLNLRNTVFVDITASADVAGVYSQLLKKSISIVACNKIAASSSYENYRSLKDLSREFDARFLFETNVGAGLPVIGTLNDLMRSGDRVQRIEAVLSGTLNFVFNNYNGTAKFAEIVQRAQDEGYTEPDPRLDLGGTDVMRKIMILAREAGEHLEMEDIDNNSFVPAACMVGTVPQFYAELEKHEAHFKSLYEPANAAGKKLKFVATYADGKASVGLQHIGADHDLFHLYGKDNVVLFYTDRYKDQPLVIKGAGAGADVTASGVFADIIRTAKS